MGAKSSSEREKELNRREAQLDKREKELDRRQMAQGTSDTKCWGCCFIQMAPQRTNASTTMVNSQVSSTRSTEINPNLSLHLV
ncbi:hypothetical protein Q8A67_005610 [Cirrhinus molitorella]|uniref:Uncharacterized protein n=1 Tax=Cirrhinus molitorella TaxID=172907 RepID=A0AA88TVJ4_9TELE|nr:hypothetical protein Q8A67_005610 [Cirrhinus molitorella]